MSTLSGSGEGSGTKRVDRRANDRIALMFRPVLIDIDGFAGLCLMRNLSSKGMMGSIGISFAPDSALIVQLNQDHRIRGRISWSRDGQIGVQFDEEIDVATVLSDLGKTENEGIPSRPLRLPIRCSGRAVLNGMAVTIEVLDISQGGLKAKGPCLRPGDTVLVLLDDMDDRKAIVRWTQGDVAGLHFLRSLGFDELASWAVRQQSYGLGPEAAPAANT